jgi:hypothetical protein
MGKTQAETDQERAQLDREYDQLDSEARALRPRLTEAHPQAIDKVLATEKAAEETQQLKGDAMARARANRDQADALERQFTAKVDQVASSGKPDPNPAQTRALSEQADKAAEAADAAEQTYRNAQQLHDHAVADQQRAETEYENAKEHDPVYQQELKPKLDDFHRRDVELNGPDGARPVELNLIHRNWELINEGIDADPAEGGDPDGTRGYPTASADTAGNSLDLAAGATDDGLIGDEGPDSGGGVADDGDPGMAAFGGTGDLDAGTSTPDNDGSLAASTDGSAPTNDEFQSGSVETDSSDWDSSAGDTTAGDTWAEADQGLEPQVVAADPPAEPEFEEFVDDSAGTTS